MLLFKTLHTAMDFLLIFRCRCSGGLSSPPALESKEVGVGSSAAANFLLTYLEVRFFPSTDIRAIFLFVCVNLKRL